MKKTPLFDICKNSELEKLIYELTTPNIHIILSSSNQQAIEEYRVDLSEIHYLGKKVRNK